MADEFEAPKCDKCGAEITTGLMAVFCPFAEQCWFWPEAPETAAFVQELRGSNDDASR